MYNYKRQLTMYHYAVSTESNDIDYKSMKKLGKKDSKVLEL